MKQNTRGLGGVFQRGGIWWIHYHHQGRRFRESSESTKRPAAVALLKRRHEETGKGRPLHEAGKVLLSDLRLLIENDYQFARRRSGARLSASWKHIAEFFGPRERALAVTAPRLAAFIARRTEEGAAPATVRNEISALKRSFNLARKGGVLLAHECPASWPSITVRNAKSGFFEQEEFLALRAALPQDEGDLIAFLHATGWRISEALGLTWKDVDLRARIIRIERTKTDTPRTLPFGVLPELVELIEKRRRVSDEVQRARGMVVQFVFHRNGDGIRHLRRAWISACCRIGLGKTVTDERGRTRRIALRTPHDFRRTFARNASRGGVPQPVIMALGGWKTTSVFLRYRIVSESDLAEGLAKMAAATPAVQERKVASMMAATATV